MMKRAELKCIKWFFLALITLTLPIGVWAQSISVQAPGRISKNQEFSIVYTVRNANVDNFSPPTIPTGLTLVGGPSRQQKSSTSIINGNVSRSQAVSYTIYLVATAAGAYTVPAANFIVEGHLVQSKSINIKVDNSNSSHNQQSVPQSMPQGMFPQSSLPSSSLFDSNVSERDLYFTVTASQTMVYEQQALLLTYRFYCGKNLGLSVGTGRTPDFKDMVTIDIENENKNPEVTQENIGGKPYKTGIVKRTLIFPQKSGTITIPGITFQCQVQPADPFGAFFASPISLERKVKDIQINVLPLPESTAAFAGAVGQLSANAEIVGDSPKTNALCTYRITLSGVGNLKLITPPKVNFPESFETYEPRITDNTKVSGEGCTGNVVFEYRFVPKKIGNFTIPETPFVYFDPNDKSYHTITLPAQKLNVKQGKRSESELQEELELMRSDIIAEPQIAPTHLMPKWGSPLYILLSFLLISAFWWLYKWAGKRLEMRCDLNVWKNRKSGKEVARALRNAEQSINENDDVFCAEILKVIKKYFAEHYKLGTGEITMQKISDLLEQDNVEQMIKDNIINLLNECEQVRFSGVSLSVSKQDFLKKANAIMDELITAINNRQ